MNIEVNPWKLEFTTFGEMGGGGKGAGRRRVYKQNPSLRGYFYDRLFKISNDNVKSNDQ